MAKQNNNKRPSGAIQDILFGGEIREKVTCERFVLFKGVCTPDTPFLGSAPGFE